MMINRVTDLIQYTILELYKVNVNDFKRQNKSNLQNKILQLTLISLIKYE